MKNYSPNHPAVRYYTENDITPSNRNVFIRRRRGAVLMATFAVLLVSTLLGGWVWIGNNLGMAVFFAMPILLVCLFLLATDLLDTPLKK